MSIFKKEEPVKQEPVNTGNGSIGLLKIAGAVVAGVVVGVIFRGVPQTKLELEEEIRKDNKKDKKGKKKGKKKNKVSTLSELNESLDKELKAMKKAKKKNAKVSFEDFGFDFSDDDKKSKKKDKKKDKKKGSKKDKKESKSKKKTSEEADEVGGRFRTPEGLQLARLIESKHSANRDSSSNNDSGAEIYEYPQSNAYGGFRPSRGTVGEEEIEEEDEDEGEGFSTDDMSDLFGFDFGASPNGIPTISDEEPEVEGYSIRNLPDLILNECDDLIKNDNEEKYYPETILGYGSILHNKVSEFESDMYEYYEEVFDEDYIENELSDVLVSMRDSLLDSLQMACVSAGIAAPVEIIMASTHYAVKYFAKWREFIESSLKDMQNDGYRGYNEINKDFEELTEFFMSTIDKITTSYKDEIDRVNSESDEDEEDESDEDYEEEVEEEVSEPVVENKPTKKDVKKQISETALRLANAKDDDKPKKDPLDGLDEDILWALKQVEDRKKAKEEPVEEEPEKEEEESEESHNELPMGFIMGLLNKSNTDDSDEVEDNSEDDENNYEEVVDKLEPIEEVPAQPQLSSDYDEDIIDANTQKSSDEEKEVSADMVTNDEDFVEILGVRYDLNEYSTTTILHLMDRYMTGPNGISQKFQEERHKINQKLIAFEDKKTFEALDNGTANVTVEQVDETELNDEDDDSEIISPEVTADDIMKNIKIYDDAEKAISPNDKFEDSLEQFIKDVNSGKVRGNVKPKPINVLR